MSWQDVDDDEEDGDGESVVDRDEFPDDADADEDEESVGEEECLYCGAMIGEDAVRCPKCGSYISKEDTPRRTAPVWVVVTAIAMLAAIVVVWVMHGF